MVGYAYDVGPRQSARVIEQAARQHAGVWAETIEQSQPRAFSGSIISCNADVIMLQMNSLGHDTYTPIAGQYFQVLISVGETRYLTVSDLLEVQTRVDGVVLMFSRPKNLQVMQRRRYHRHIPGQAFPVYISWQEDEGETAGQANNTPALGQMKDLSLHGMSVRVPENLDNHLFIGDLVYLRFSLSVRETEYFSSATICHKELLRDRSELVLGLQFVNSEQNPDFVARLKSILTQDLFNKDTTQDTK